MEDEFAQNTEQDAPAEKDYKLPLNILIIPLRDLVVFPSMIITVYVRNEKLIDAINKASQDGELIGLITQKSSSKPVPPVENLFDVGTSASVLQVIKSGSGNDAMVLVEGISRFKVRQFTQEKPFLQANINPIAKSEDADVDLQAGAQEIKDLIARLALEGKNLPPEVITGLSKIHNFDDIIDLACSLLTLEIIKKQELLSMTDPAKRIKLILDYLNKEIQLSKIRKKIHTDISQELNKSERNYLLRQELKAIKKELGEDEEDVLGMGGMTDKEDIRDLEQLIKKAMMPESVEKIARKELDRLKKIIPISPEYTVARTYIEWLCDMPWEKSCPVKADVKKARKILDEDHYGLEKVKERILEFLAVCQLNNKRGATILCFVGPPGVGKTSLGQSIARALGRAFVHTSLGGIRDEADIRGHRRTYVGAMPGRIIQSLKRAGYNDPVFMLDEIDKVGKDFQGDPAAALMEALDPEQNHAFTDHYLDVPFDLSKVFFITTANFLDPIPPALLDRMEVIELPGYTEEEKLQIAIKYLIPKQKIANGLESRKLIFTDDAILKLVRSYTNEAGLRELERQIASICRKVAKDLIEKKLVKTPKIDSAKVEQYLGVDKYEFEKAQEEDMVGVTTGLAWTPYGGDILFIEATRMPGDKNLIMTGNLGDVMQESARAALSYIRSNSHKFHISDDIFKKSDIHIHVPEGAVPKDGPSAGITICTALISLLTNQKVRRDVAMTGEVTLTGRILPIGGLKEKILAAKRANIKTIILPEKNKKDVTEIPAVILKGVTLKYASTLDDVLKIALIPSKRNPDDKLKEEPITTHLPNIKKKATIRIVKLPVPQQK
jgi:ATP-dependent Lon protease